MSVCQYGRSELVKGSTCGLDWSEPLDLSEAILPAGLVKIQLYSEATSGMKSLFNNKLLPPFLVRDGLKINMLPTAVFVFVNLIVISEL